MKQFYSKKIFGINVIAQRKKYLNIMEDTLLNLLNLDKILFHKTTKLLGTIFITPFNDFYNELFLKNNIWFVDKDFLNEKKNYKGALIAGLVHETYHRYQYTTGKIEKKPGRVADNIEQDAYKIQIAFLKKHNFLDELKRVKNQLSESVWKNDDPLRKSDNKYENLLKLYKSGKLKIIKV